MSNVPVPPPRHKKKTHDEKSHSEMTSPMMAGAAHNVARHLAPSYQDVSSTPNLQQGQGRSAAHLQNDNGPRAITPTGLDEGIPETTIGEYVTVKGELEFDRLLRIDGNFEGRLLSEGDLVVGPQGKLKGNVDNIRSMLVEGHVIGNISVERLALRGAAYVYGDITCRSLSMEPSVMVAGKLNVHPLAPKAINADGSVSSSSTEALKTETSAPAHQRQQGQFHFPGSDKGNEQLVVSPDKRTLVPLEHAASAVSISSEAIKKQHEEEVALQKLGEQRSQLEVQISQQKEHALRAREEEERELQRLKAEAERLREEEQRHVAEAKRLQEEAAVEVARLQAEAAKRAASTVPQDATPSPDIVA